MTSLRWRLTGVLLLLTVVVVLIMDVVVYRSAVGERGNRLRQDASQEARSAAVIFASTGALVPGATLNDTSAPDALRRGIEQGRGGTQAEGSSRMWAAAAVGGFAPGDASGVYVNISAKSDTRALSSLRSNLIAVSATIVGIGVLVAFLVSSGLVRRLTHAADVARRIGDGDLDARIGHRGRDEIAALSRVVDDMADSVQQRIARERRFTADAAHELRTPVTGLVAAAYLLPEDDPTSALVRTGSERLRHVVEDLLEISRLESGHESAEIRPVDLGAIVGDIVARYPQPIVVTGGGRASTDPRRLDRVVSNLLENAFRHGAPPVTVAITGSSITVTDHGPGYALAQLDHLTEPFVTSGNGTGLGLAIASEQARVLGATLSLANHQGGGASATLSWPDAPSPLSEASDVRGV